jgi:hypothetical protein
MKARDQLALLVATSHAFAGGDAAQALVKKLEAASRSDEEATQSRWRPSKKRSAQ